MSLPYIQPSPSLCRYVAGYVVSTYDNGFSNAITSMYPIGAAILCFSLDNAVVCTEVGKTSIIKHTRFNFIHQFTHPRFYQVIASPKKVLHVIFQPYGAYKLLGIPQDGSFDEHGTSLSDMLGPTIHPLLKQIEDAGDNIYRVIEMVDDWLEHQLTKNEKMDVARISHACSLITANQGSISIEQLAQKVCLSKRVLEYKFKEQVGVSPKLYSRIIRFNSLLADIKSHKFKDWQELVLQYNYFDQAHFIKDFKRFSGSSPAHYPPIRSIIA
ncbi:AraC-like DNA-binding protein [Chitinophaga dinghuensis]|uniref:AraC-like DNA-binding protein n=1 Tax=Chitinophaga dinghuensis TaxID=1539050 RepID=A0A327VLP0_9BACT|nr:AraC family transcriptional regulator [Chitinophaga dinghuensis]RAJ73729.1 AraC-like DNA-binding protein [Chitinophaga dinghuensis]